MPRNRRLIWLLVAVGVVTLLVFLLKSTDLTLGDQVDNPRLIYLVALAAVMAGSLFYRLRAEPGRTLSQMALWVAIFAGLILAYSFRGEVSMLGVRLSGELMPMAGRVEGPRSVSYPIAENGHFQIEADLDGSNIDFTVDTGATAIVLSPQAAARLGYDLTRLTFDGIAETANGTVRTASIVISELKLGPIVLHDVPARVNEAEMSTSLLGMEFLRRLKSWRVEGERLTLEQ